MRILIFVWFTVFSVYTFSQSGVATFQNCLNAKKVYIEDQSSIFMVSPEDYLIVDTSGNYVVFLEKHEESSVWYEFTPNQEVELSFTIFPKDSGNNYNFFLYEGLDNKDFCTKLYLKNEEPERANLFRDEMKEGIGLNKKSVVSYTDTMFSDLILFHTPFHKSLKLKPEFNYYLNIAHTKGGDCEHNLIVNTGGENFNMRAPLVTCFNEPFIKLRSPILPDWVNSRFEKSISKRKESIKSSVLKGKVQDETGRPVFTEIIITNPVSGEHYELISKVNGTFEIELLPSSNYFFEFSSIGYHNTRIQHLSQSGTHELMVKLSSLKPGEMFALNNIYFHPSTYAFKSSSVPELDKLLNYLLENSDVVIAVHGHTNGKGKVKGKSELEYLGEGWDFQGNEKKLSKYRADAVRKYLMEKGVQSDRVSTAGMGADKMIYPSPRNQKEKDMNKRVEIHIVSKSNP